MYVFLPNRVLCLDTSYAVYLEGTGALADTMLHGSPAFRPRFVDLGSESFLQAQIIRSCIVFALLLGDNSTRIPSFIVHFTVLVD